MTETELDGPLHAGSALIDYSLKADYESLPPEVVDRVKMVVFDQLACTYVGMELPTGRLATRYALDTGGRPESSLVRTSERLPAAVAAWVNGTAGHAAELDCAHAMTDSRATGHPAIVIVPAALAVAERQSATGRDLITAVALGFDVGARCVSATGGLVTMREQHGLYGGCLYSVGAALCCARLLRLDRMATTHAASFAVGQSASPTAFFAERRHMSKAIVKGGQPAAAGVSGALMAAAGLEASDDPLSGPGGLIATWGEPGRHGELGAGLGEDHAVLGANFKFYAAGYPIHAPVEAALQLASRNRIAPSAITAITVGMPAFAASVVDSRAMPTICVQDMLAVALVAGKLTFHEAHSTELLGDPEVRRLREQTVVEVDPELESAQPNGRGARVTIHMGEASVSELVEHPRGHRFRCPAPGWADLREKWASVLQGRMGTSRFEDLWEACRSLESADDLRHLSDVISL